MDGRKEGHDISCPYKSEAVGVAIVLAVLDVGSFCGGTVDRREHVNRDEAWTLAREWVAAWNAHDLEAILTHYEESVELTSPVAAQLLGKADGKVVGKANLRAYFQRGLEAYPELRFELEDVMWGLSSVVLCYKNQKGTRTAEFMELSANGKVVRVVANYSA